MNSWDDKAEPGKRGPTQGLSAHGSLVCASFTSICGCRRICLTRKEGVKHKGLENSGVGTRSPRSCEHFVPMLDASSLSTRGKGCICQHIGLSPPHALFLTAPYAKSKNVIRQAASLTRSTKETAHFGGGSQILSQTHMVSSWF